MLQKIAASVAASYASVKLPPKQIEVDDQNLKPCTCGCTKFWIPVGHRDVKSSYRCSNCFSPPSMALVAKEIDLDLIDVPVFQVTFNTFKPSCFRCGGSLVSMSQNGYSCATCAMGIHPEISAEFWG
jgi:hypothetical protein